MPYKREGGVKVSDHHVRSPLLNINRACQGCHKWSEEELRSRAETIQTRFFDLRNQAMDAVVGLIGDLKAAREAGRSDAELESPRYLQRRAQFYLDFVEAENSTGFHASQEATRILGESINYARQGQIALRDPAFKPTVPVVKIATASPGPNQAPPAAPPTEGAAAPAGAPGSGAAPPAAPPSTAAKR
jgi:nitrite reductase (cytochrome c-552)